MPGVQTSFWKHTLHQIQPCLCIGWWRLHVVQVGGGYKIVHGIGHYADLPPHQVTSGLPTCRCFKAYSLLLLFRCSSFFLCHFLLLESESMQMISPNTSLMSIFHWLLLSFSTSSSPPLSFTSFSPFTSFTSAPCLSKNHVLLLHPLPYFSSSSPPAG